MFCFRQGGGVYHAGVGSSGGGRSEARPGEGWDTSEAARRMRDFEPNVDKRLPSSSPLSQRPKPRDLETREKP